MTSQYFNTTWLIVFQYGLPILLVLSITWLIIVLMRLKVLSNKLHAIPQREMALQTQLHDAYQKHDALTNQLQELQTEVNHFQQITTTTINDITGLPNYQTVMSRINAELSRCARIHCSCAILFVHLDSFHHIDTTLQQDASNAILLTASSCLQQGIRTEDFIGCYDRGNFLLLLTEADLAGAIRTAERLRLDISSHPYFPSTEEAAAQTPLAITASIGIAAYELHGNTADALVQRAASAIHQANNNEINHTRIANVDEVIPPFSTQQEGSDEQAMTNALTAAASAHHTETDKHAHRLVILAEETAHELSCSEQEIRLVHLSALLHDIGKIGIPDAILDKPGPLSEEEWEIMRLHPLIGQRILCQAGGIFATLAHIIVAHHERWDGKGYPVGLAENTIPIEARILTVVDSFDAMTSRRVYRQPTSIEDARLELLRCAGKQFDPEVVIAFLRVLNRSASDDISLPATQQNTESSSISVI
jgi:diguanylate cyclase (GGDEF)-like protein